MNHAGEMPWRQSDEDTMSLSSRLMMLLRVSVMFVDDVICKFKDDNAG